MAGGPLPFISSLFHQFVTVPLPALCIILTILLWPQDSYKVDQVGSSSCLKQSKN